MAHITLEVTWVEDGETKKLKAETNDFDVAGMELGKLERAYQEHVRFHAHARTMDADF